MVNCLYSFFGLLQEVNKLQMTLNLFEELMQSKYLHCLYSASVILLLNKVDVFEDKVRRGTLNLVEILPCDGDNGIIMILTYC